MPFDVIATVGARAFDLGLVLTVFGLGFRHGIDWDHIAAITDITSSQDNRKHAMLFGTIYALGHALVVFILGVLAIILGTHLPEGIDKIMGRIVGFTLVLLGVYVFVSLIKHGREFRLRSRWMLIFSGVRKGARWAKNRVSVPAGSPEAAEIAGAEHEMEEHEVAMWHHGHHGQLGHHHHGHPEHHQKHQDDEAFANYGTRTSFVVGMLHGIGAETPTQIIVISGVVVAGGAAVSVAVLVAFLVGLLTSNTLITLGSAYGFLGATKNFKLYATVAVLTGVFSLVVGTIFLLGKEPGLPVIFGG